MKEVNYQDSNNSNQRLLSPSNRYQRKRFVKVGLYALIIDLIILCTFGFMAILPFTDPDIGSFIFWFGLITTLTITLIIALYSIIGIPWLIRTLSYEIKKDALAVKRGRLNKVEIYVPYRTITNIGITRGPFDRFFNIGHISIETAGTALAISGKFGVDQYLEGLDEEILKKTYDFIYNKIKELKGIYTTTTEEQVLVSDEFSKENDSLPKLIKELTNEIRKFRKAVEGSQ